MLRTTWEWKSGVPHVLRGTWALALVVVSCCSVVGGDLVSSKSEIERWERPRILRLADSLLTTEPQTITAIPCGRSAGGRHDYFSEGDYWWPDPDHPQGPYIRRDGLTNPENFVAHRNVLRSMSITVPALVAAFKVTGDRLYADRAMEHLIAWFIDTTTMMNPHFTYSQAIKGICTGRAPGVIDGIHLAEVAQSIRALERSGYLKGADLASLKNWFRQLLWWLTTHPYGLEERGLGNNHTVCWTVQVGAYALMLNDKERLDSCVAFFKNVLLPDQMAGDGSFPKELQRTKPYGYSLFTLDAMAMVCQICLLGREDLFAFALPDGRSFKRGMEFMVPFIRDRSTWHKPPDVMYNDYWPVRHPALLLAGLAFHEHSYIELWKSLEADPSVEEVVRNFPYRQPVLWLD